MKHAEGGGAGREPKVLGSTTRIVRLLAWLAAFALFAALLWLPVTSAVRAADPHAAAWALGQAGTAAAGAIARDPASAGKVPGYTGTAVPERSLAATGMEDAARARLADPDDPGGAAGRTVVEGVTVRPPVGVPGSDPLVQRSETITASPRSSAHGAEGLATGSVADCGAGVADAGRGGACGRVSYCVGAGCESVDAQGNTGFVDAAARLNMVLEMGGEEFDRDSLRFFRGERRACRIRWGGLANCCRNSGLLVGLAGCSAAEIELGKQRHAGNTHYLGTRCAKRVFGVCLKRERVWCVFTSKLGRILHSQARPQLGIGWGSCRGFTVAEIERIDFSGLDLSEFTENLTDGAMEPSVSLPEKGDTQTFMRDRVRDFYSRSQ